FAGGADLLPDGLGQRPRGSAVVVSGLRELHGLLAQPGAAAFVADLPAPAAHQAPAAVGQQGLGDRTGARDQQRSGAATMGTQQRREAVGAQREAGGAGVGVDESLQLRGNARTGQTEAERTIAQLQARYAGIRNGLADVAPGLLGTLPQRRRAGLAAA